MPAKKFIIPFAATGDKTAVPNTLQPDGTVSYAQGFGPDYELDKTLDPVNAKDVPRDQTNQLYFDLTDAVGEQQLYGVALWGADRAPYPLNARAYHLDKLWRSNVTNNSGVPGVAGWDDVSAQSPDLLNTTRINVASASTVNLTTSAPATRHINITGNTAITGFTVAAGRCYFVRFAGALTLTNGASLVTQTAANINTADGDTCIIRAISDDVVEILSYVPAGGWIKSHTTNGYQKLPSGLIIQWGNGQASNGGSAMSWPIAFPIAAFSVVAMHIGNVPSQSGVISAVSTTTGATFYNSGSISPVAILYIAIGC